MTFLGARSAEPTPHVTGLHAGDDLQASPTRLRLDGVRAHALEVGRTRLLITGLLFLLAFVAIGARIVDIAVFERAPEVAKAATQSQNRADTPDVARADIVDRNGVVLATSLPTQSLYAKAEQVQDPFAAAAKLVAVLPDLDELDTVSKLSSGKPFLYLRRNLTPHQQYDVNALGIPGLYFEKGEHRVYPLGNLLAHAVGIANIDGKGVAGLESRFDQRLLESRLPVIN